MISLLSLAVVICVQLVAHASLSSAFQCHVSGRLERHFTRSRHTTTLFALEYETNDGIIQHILKKYGFAGRLVSLHNDDLSLRPLPAELYDKGTWKLCLITGLKLPSSSKTNDAKPPLLQVLIMDDAGLFAENKVVDIGQITFLWSDFYERFHVSPNDGLEMTLQRKYGEALQSLKSNILMTEDAMQNLYNSRIANRSRSPSNHHRHVLTKKNIPTIAAGNILLEELLRNLIKVGDDRSSRMVDSALAIDYLYTDFCREGDDEQLMRRMIAATVLTDDANSGGRFKRRSCQFIECSSIIEDSICKSITLFNGGFVSVDPSIRAGTEGRKFAAATNQKKDANTASPVLLTAADERIAHRLECLAMGDVWKNERFDYGDEEKTLELDVREALSTMGLPLTADGATRALIQLGRWSQNDAETMSKKAKVIEPWSAEVIDAARKLVTFREKRRVEISSARKKNKPCDFDARVDLSSLPCVCIDAKRATFRDDCIGIRLRSSTGREVTPASKWEILIHIADVSIIYEDDRAQFNILREAAERRGQSRYDLPFGPLHLLPPVALSALALSTDDNSTNECVSVWAYIDERDGKLIEAGLERTIIGCPQALSFDDATKLLESGSQDVPKSLINIRAIIAVAERNLSLWSRHHRESSEAAQKREKRLATKELISQELSVASGHAVRDDGVGGSFQRSRGHRLVDSSLDLYAVAITSLMKQKNKPVPRAAGSGTDRGGRLCTGPLRRYIDGMCQRQALAVLCEHGKPLSLDECKEASKIASRASDTVANLRPTKKRDGSITDNKQRGALHKIARHISSTGARTLKAISTGHNNEVVILGTGAVARCRGVKGTLKGGQKLLIEVITIDAERGLLDVSLTS
ncbi:hypothetical protein ACHAXM_007571 [Skeletonema potamos]